MSHEGWLGDGDAVLAEALMEELEDLRDRLSIHEREGVTIPAEKLWAELGL